LSHGSDDQAKANCAEPPAPPSRGLLISGILVWSKPRPAAARCGGLTRVALGRGKAGADANAAEASTARMNLLPKTFQHSITRCRDGTGLLTIRSTVVRGVRNQARVPREANASRASVFFIQRPFQ
jgi:hypothetical protein